MITILSRYLVWNPGQLSISFEKIFIRGAACCEEGDQNKIL